MQNNIQGWQGVITVIVKKPMPAAVFHSKIYSLVGILASQKLPYIDTVDLKVYMNTKFGPDFNLVSEINYIVQCYAMDESKIFVR
jgi:hypothetical protein